MSASSPQWQAPAPRSRPQPPHRDLLTLGWTLTRSAVRVPVFVLDVLGTLALQHLVRLLIERIDITDLVLDEVDLDRIVSRVDADAVVARVDLDAIIARIDLIGLSQMVIEAIDLPSIIRGSSGAMASEGVAGLRIQGVAADERLNRLVDRMLLRRNHHQQVPLDAPLEPPLADRDVTAGNRTPSIDGVGTIGTGRSGDDGILGDSPDLNGHILPIEPTES